MQFLDAIGLAYFWEKIKASFVSTKGESVINTDDDNYGLSVQNIGSTTTTLTPSGFVSYNNIGDETDMVARLQYGDLLLSKIHLKHGTSSQILIADGSTKTINAANGICGLDANGRIPLAQLGNLDTSLFKLVTSLPSSGESNKIYIVKDGSDANDVYQEYYYTNGAWEKIGTHTVKVDLSPYAKTADVNKALAKKVDVVSGKGLSTEDFTTALKTKLNGIATGATADSAIPISVIDALN